MQRSFRRRRTAAALAGSCPAIAAQQVPPLGRGRGSRGQSRTPRFCWAALSCPPPPARSLLLGSPGRGGWGCIRHLLRSSRFVGLVLLLSAKRQSKEGKDFQSSDVVRRCPGTLFPIVISGGGVGWGVNLFVSVQKRAIGFHVHEDISFRKGGTICP